MSLLSAPSAPPYGFPTQDEVPCERCRHSAGAHHDGTSCSVRNWWGRRCRCSGYFRSDSATPVPGPRSPVDPAIGITRARWRPLLLVTGALLVVIGVVLPSGWAFVPGLLVLLVAVLTEAEPSPCRSVAQMTAAHWSG
jgi:hypothetical protein